MHPHTLLIILLSLFAALTASLPAPSPCADDTETTASLPTSEPTSDPCADDTATTTSLPSSTSLSPLPPTTTPFGPPVLSPPEPARNPTPNPKPILFLPSSPTNLTRRETLVNIPANIDIYAFLTPDCTGGYMTAGASYSVAYVNPDSYQSYKLSRDMMEGEQLDVSGPPECDNFLLWKTRVTGGECVRLARPVTCLRFWHW